MTRILIVDDHPVFRKGLRHLISDVPGLAVVGEADEVSLAAGQLASLLPDVAIIDLNLGGKSGLELIQVCRGLTPAPAPIVLTVHREESIFDAALRSGVAAYVLKESACDDVVLAIRAVASGGFFLSNSLRDLLDRRSVREMAAAGSKGLVSLTPSERKVIRLIAANRTTKEIAHELCVSPRTVESHRAHICERLGLHGAQSLLRYALENREQF